MMIKGFHLNLNEKSWVARNRFDQERIMKKDKEAKAVKNSSCKQFAFIRQT